MSTTTRSRYTRVVNRLKKCIIDITNGIPSLEIELYSRESCHDSPHLLCVSDFSRPIKGSERSNRGSCRCPEPLTLLPYVILCIIYFNPNKYI
uniref:Ovule protein n=1 Tax=Heterorhabditis bacteriophora TaxID=37862 RepID=A0A1I7WG77_HETBA